MKKIYFLTTILFLCSINLIAQTTDVVTGLFKSESLLFNGNDLYITEYGDNKISKIDITAATPNPTDVVETDVVVTGLTQSPMGMVFKENDLYIAIFYGGKISKSTLPVLSTNDYLAESSFKLYPNPSKDFIKISGLTKEENYTIYSIIGTKIIKGSISNNKRIDIKKIRNGVYFLNFDNGNTIKFINK